MSFLDSLIISVFGLGMVFVILVGLSWFISIESKLFAFLKKESTPTAETAIAADTEVVFDTGFTAGELKLIDVDEKTAAMIMAIVSDESKIPLSELQFKSIKALD